MRRQVTDAMPETDTSVGDELTIDNYLDNRSIASGMNRARGYL